jgi:hypothetical protein
VLQFVVMDKRCRDLYGYTGDNDFTAGNFIPRIGETSAYFLEGQTLEDLADRFAERLQRHAHLLDAIELDGHFVDNLRAAIDRFNGFARSGNDEDFARGQTGIEQWFMGLDNELRADAAKAATESPNPSMAPLSDEGPYYGIILAPGTLDTKGGPKVNQKLQILDGDERAVPGLYGLGNCVASASGQAYWSAGCTWGPYLTFGYVAARNIIQEPVKGTSIAQAHVN